MSGGCKVQKNKDTTKINKERDKEIHKLQRNQDYKQNIIAIISNNKNTIKFVSMLNQ